MKKVLFFFVFIFASFVGQSQPTIYEKDAYGGQSCTIGCSESNLDRARWGDCISSCTVPEGWTIVFYEHSGFRGATFTVGKNTPYFKDFGWNDDADAVKVYYNGVLQGDCVWKDPNADRCSQCNGSGDIICCRGEAYRTCPKCNGTGKN